MKSIFTFLFLLGICITKAQNPTVGISISRDTVLLGNAFYLQYTFDSKDGQFLAPSISGAQIISQNYMSNTSVINGEIKALHKQTYLIQPTRTGILTIPATTIKSAQVDMGDVEVPMVEIYVAPNPQSLEIDPQDDSSWKMIDLLQGKVIKRKSKKI